MRNIHIENSYNIWTTKRMKDMIIEKCGQLGVNDVEIYLNRSFSSMYIEWWMHNIGYYLTKPFCRFETIKKLNLRFKHVDINELDNE